MKHRIRILFFATVPRLKRAILAFLVTSLVSPAFSLQPDEGSVCVASLPDPIDGRRGAGPQAVNCSGKLSVKIDTQKTILWPTNESVKIDRLSLTARHRVLVLCDNKAVQSFGFRFSDFKTKTLCLFFNDLYWTVQLWGSKQSPWCKCQ